MKVGMITIGQSPRKDVTSEIRGIIGKVEIVERGCLDGLTEEQIRSLKPDEGEPFLVTLLRGGSSIQVSRGKVIDLIQKRVGELEKENVNLTVLLCTEDFPDFKSEKPVIEPGKLIYSVVQSVITKDRKVGVLIPSFGQMEQARKKWSKMNPVITAVSPYENQEKIEEAAKTLKTKNVDLTVLDCIGYTRQIKRKVRKITGKPVILSRTLVARVLKEFINFE